MTSQQFMQYVETHQKSVRRFLTALCCGDAELADDLAQDTFVKAYLSCDSFRNERAFTSWIFRIAYNTFLSNHRSSRQYVTLNEIEQRISASEKTDSGFDYQELYAALECLNKKERSSILLHYMQGYSISEIAEMTETSTDAVKQQLSRGRKNLKNILSK